jgi:glycosyltransferase involved in cell wall biosynthesis
MNERPLRVFYNASALPPRPAGAGVYTLELGRALAAQPGIDVVAAAPEPYAFGGETTRPKPAGRGRQGWEMVALSGVLARSGADVYHGPHFFVPHTVVPAVATVHDLTFYRLPGRYSFAHRRYYRYLARCAKRAARIIAPSGAVAADIVRFLGYPPERIRVIAEAPRAGLAPAREPEVARLRGELTLEAPYLLCLGTAEPGKRAVDAVRAMPAILEQAPGTVLALAGNPGRLSPALEREVARLGVGDAVRFLGYVPDESLGALLSGATALVFPSLFEGFGLPPLEAMACGTPVISTDAPAMSEVLAGAATLVPVRDPGAIAAEALRLLGDPGLRAERSARGIEFASRFSWQRTAEETIDVYREVAP